MTSNLINPTLPTVHPAGDCNHITFAFYCPLQRSVCTTNYTRAAAVLQDLHKQTDKVQHQAKERALPLTLCRNLKANGHIYMLQLLQQRQLQDPLVDLVEDLGPSLLT